jgi:hypothetical protein
MRGKLKITVMIQLQTSVQLWKTQRIMRLSIRCETLLERISKFRPKRVSVIVDQSTINSVLMRKVNSWLIKGSKLNYNGCRTQVK